MENGVGAVDGGSESKIEGGFPIDLPVSKEPEGDEVFEEAVDDNLEDGVQQLGEDSNEGGAGGGGGDGVVSEDEVMQDARTLSDGFGSDENDDVSVEGNDGAVSDKGDTDNEGVRVDEAKGVGNEDVVGETQVAVDSQSEEKVEPDNYSVEERGISESEGHERVDDEPTQVVTAEEKLKEGDTEEIVGNGDDADQLGTSDEPVACANVNEMETELLSEASAGDQNDVREVAEEGKDSGSLDPIVAMPASDGHLQNGIASLDVSDNNELQNGIASMDVSDNNELQNGADGVIENAPASASEQKEGDKSVDVDSYEESNSVERGILASEIEISKSSDDSPSLKNKECEVIASDSERQYTSIDQAQSTSVEVGLKDVEAAVEGKQNRQGSQETETKPAAPAVSSVEKSANPVLPSLRPAGLGPSAPAGLGHSSPAGLGRSAPAGLGRSGPLLEPAPRVVHQQPRYNGAVVPEAQPQIIEEVGNGEVEEVDETREKLQMIRVKFLRLAHRLGQTPHNVVVAQVLYRLGLAEQLRGRNGGRTGAFSYDRASAIAEQLEQTGGEPLDFACTIMVLGKTGVGKSATINSIFDEVRFNTDAFDVGTTKVQEVEGTVQGIKVRIIDTPGLFPSWSEQLKNEKILNSVKKFMKKSPPDIILYLDRLDMPSRDFSDMPLLRSVTDMFGPTIWFNAIVVLTHAASAPPEGPNGTASSYDMFVTQRSHSIQQAIRQAAGDMRLMNPVSLVENHSACRTNRAGQRVLPNGQVWKPHLLLLSFASKILAEANTLLKLQDTPPGKPATARSRAPPLPFLLSSLLQSKPQLKLPDEQLGEVDSFDDDSDHSSDEDEDSEYDELPPFKRLTNAQLAKLPKEQKRAYYDELEYRERLFMKKQLKEERKRRKMMKKMAELAKDMPVNSEENAEEEESSGAASIPVPMPDLALPASFDADNPTHRYRFLDTSNQWLVRPVLDAHGWDHDVGYEGINVERLLVVKDKIPVSFSGQVSKDKKESSLQMEVASSIKHGEGKGTTMGFDMQSVGKDMAYTLRSETLFSNYKRNKATAGLSFTLLGDAMTAGLKLEDKLVVNKQLRVVMSGGAMTGRGDTAYGGSLEATLRDKDPLGRFLSSMGLSVMDWHGDLAIGCNIQTQIPVGRSTNLVARANLNNRGSGQVSLRLNSSEQMQLALIGLIPLLKKVVSQYSASQQQ